MTLRACVCALLVLVAASASAQMTVQPLQEAKPSPAKPRMEALQVAPSPAQPVVATDEVQPSELQLQTPEARLKRRVAELERKSAKLEAENAQLRQRVLNFTSLGGSEVRAYCSARTVSANTAGAKRDCGAYSCNDVTGQCLETCREASDCGGQGANCNAGKCIFGMPPCEGENCS